jgi:hypothetical protein
MHIEWREMFDIAKQRRKIMPYKHEGFKIPRKYNSRVKLSDDERNDIKELYKQGKFIREIARLYEHRVSRRCIQFVLFPERMISANKNHNWKKYYNKDRRREEMKVHRRRKQKLFIENKLVKGSKTHNHSEVF